MHQSSTSKVRKITQVDWSSDEDSQLPNKKPHINWIFQIKFHPNINKYDDKTQCKELMSILNQCELIRESQMPVSRYILKEIAEYACGFIKPCIVCNRGEILILQSSIVLAAIHSYCDAEESHYCNNSRCGIESYIHVCDLCQNLADVNAWWLDGQQLSQTKDVGRPMISCIACDLEDYRCMELCYNCRYLCYGCGNRFCTKYHKSMECIECCQQYCPRCTAFSDEGYRLLYFLDSDYKLGMINRNRCITCHCHLNVFEKDFNYKYKFDNYKDRFGYFLLIQTLLCTEMVRNYNMETEMVSIIAHYACGLHFVDEEGIHNKMQWNDQFQFTESITIFSTCELSLMHEDLIPYSCHSVQYDCLAANVSTSTTTTSGSDMCTCNNEEHCTWYVHFCDICKVNCWANKYDGYTQINPLYPSRIDKIALETICHTCIKDKGDDDGCFHGGGASKTVKICKYCGFKCKCCVTFNCNSHLSFICSGGCNGKYCQECVAGWYGYNIKFIQNCYCCDAKICMWCKKSRGNTLLCEECNDGQLIKLFIFD